MTDLAPEVKALAEAWAEQIGRLEEYASGTYTIAVIYAATGLLTKLKKLGFTVVREKPIEIGPQEIKGAAVRLMENVRDDPDS